MFNNKPNVMPINRSLLTISMVARQAGYMCRNIAARCSFNVDEFVIGTKLSGELKQRYVNVLMSENDLRCSLDEIADKRLKSPMEELGGFLLEDDAFWTFKLPHPNDASSATHQYDGLNLRLVMVSCDGHDAYLCRFDVLYLTSGEQKRS